MKIVLIVIVLITCPFMLKGQVISTFAGGGSGGDGSPATAAYVSDPNGGIFDKYGNYYYGSRGTDQVKKIDTFGIISTVVGTGTGGYSGDNGPATAAMINGPESVKFDTAGNLYIAETNNNIIRKVDVITGIITTVAGTGVAGYNGDGIPATNAQLNGPHDVCFDRFGNMYISDNENNRVRKVDIYGNISTFAGTGIYGYNGDGILATAAQLWVTWGLAIDTAGDIFISELGGLRIRKVSTTNIITTVAGNGVGWLYDGDEIAATLAQIAPAQIAIDASGALYVAEFLNNNRVRKIDNMGIIHTIAGNGIWAFSGDGGPATAASLGHPDGVALDRCNNVYIADVDNNRIRKVTYDTSCHIHSYSTLGVKYPGSFEMAVYPNPTYDMLQVDNVSSPTAYRIYNMVGVTGLSGTLTKGDNSIPLRQLPAGIYLLELIDDKGQKTVKKIIKE